MILWSDDRRVLRAALAAGQDFLAGELGLELKPVPYLNRTDHGLDYLGCRVFRHHLLLNRRSRLRYRRKLLHLERQFEAGELAEACLQQRATALTAFTRTPGLVNWRFRRAVVELSSYSAGAEAPPVGRLS